jgi:hypothetical protein
MRIFGSSFLDLWAWDGYSSTNFTGTSDMKIQATEQRTCGPPCAVRWGIDDANIPVLAPCPLGEGTGFLVTNVTEKLTLPIQCVITPPVASAMNDSMPWPTFSPHHAAADGSDLFGSKEPTVIPSDEPWMSPTEEPTLSTDEEPTLVPSSQPEPIALPTTTPVTVSTIRAPPSLAGSQRLPIVERPIAIRQEEAAPAIQEFRVDTTAQPSVGALSSVTVGGAEEPMMSSTLEPMSPTDGPSVSTSTEPEPLQTMEPSMWQTSEPEATHEGFNMHNTVEPEPTTTDEPIMPSFEPTPCIMDKPGISATEEPSASPAYAECGETTDENVPMSTEEPAASHESSFVPYYDPSLVLIGPAPRDAPASSSEP